MNSFPYIFVHLCCTWNLPSVAAIEEHLEQLREVLPDFPGPHYACGHSTEACLLNAQFQTIYQQNGQL
jgi:hypothetical protein